MKRMWMIILGVALLVALAARSATALLNATVPNAGYARHVDVAYGAHARQKMDIYVPDGLTASAPVVVFFYGGSWQSGDKADYKFVAQRLTTEGFVVAVPDYRLYPDVVFPAFLQDGAAAINWVHKNIGEYKGDAQRLFVMGHSAGAYNAAMLTLNREYLRAVGGNADWIRGMVGLSGPYDFDPLKTPDVKKIFENTADIETTKPIRYARADAPPILLLHGTPDEKVLPKNSRNLAAALHALGAPVTLKEYDVGHVWMILEFASTLHKDSMIVQDAVRFLRQQAKD